MLISYLSFNLVMTSIALGVNDKLPGASTNFEGYAAAFWSVVGMDGIMLCITLLFVQSHNGRQVS